MAVNNFIVTSLPEYVQTNQEQILKNFGLVGEGTRGRIGLQTGIKSKAQLNYFEVAPVFQNGKGCGFNPLGSVTLTARDIEVAIIKTDMTICPDNLIGTYAEYLVRINATSEELPFEEYILDGITKSVKEYIEKLIWQGDKDSEDDQLAFIDGFLKLAADEEGVIDVDLTAQTSAYQGLLAIYMAMPEEVLKRGGVIFVSPAVYRAFTQEIIGLNLYHYPGTANGAAPAEVFLPGTDVLVVKIEGLAGTYSVLGTFAKNLVYGTDFENDSEEIDLHYSNDLKYFLLTVKWASGVQVAFPELIVFGTFGSAPVISGGNAAALQSIAASTGKLAGAVNANNQVETHPNADAEE